MCLRTGGRSTAGYVPGRLRRRGGNVPRRSGEAEIGRGSPLKETGNRADDRRGSVLECAQRQLPLSPAAPHRGSAIHPGLLWAPRGLDRGLGGTPNGGAGGPPVLASSAFSAPPREKVRVARRSADRGGIPADSERPQIHPVTAEARLLRGRWGFRGADRRSFDRRLRSGTPPASGRERAAEERRSGEPTCRIGSSFVEGPRRDRGLGDGDHRAG